MRNSRNERENLLIWGSFCWWQNLRNGPIKKEGKSVEPAKDAILLHHSDTETSLIQEKPLGFQLNSIMTTTVVFYIDVCLFLGDNDRKSSINLFMSYTPEVWHDFHVKITPSDSIRSTLGGAFSTWRWSDLRLGFCRMRQLQQHTDSTEAAKPVRLRWPWQKSKKVEVPVEVRNETQKKSRKTLENVASISVSSERRFSYPILFMYPQIFTVLFWDFPGSTHFIPKKSRVRVSLFQALRLLMQQKQGTSFLFGLGTWHIPK